MLKQLLLTLSLFLSVNPYIFAAAVFSRALPVANTRYEIDGPALCKTAKQTLAYLNKGKAYDPEVIHPGKALPIPISRIKATLLFICRNQHKLNDPNFVRQHFEFIRWQPDIAHAKQFATNRSLLRNLPNDRILMTKYYVHLANASMKPSKTMPYALYALPKDEQNLSLERADANPNLIRFKYGKQAILTGALNAKNVPKLAYLSRDDLEAALMQGTIVADFGGSRGRKIFNVHRCNGIAYDKIKPAYEQERYWYFKQVDGIKGYGKDSNNKITVDIGVTFAADLTQLGLGKLLMVQYPDPSGILITKAGILADTGGAFSDNLYQVDYLAGTYRNREEYFRSTAHLPDFVYAYFMVVKKK